VTQLPSGGQLYVMGLIGRAKYGGCTLNYGASRRTLTG
jgi:hypothetical protein